MRPGRVIVHKHRCPFCGDKFPCQLKCDDMQDGENGCGSCAESRFDQIVPQETMARKVPDGRS